MTINAACLFITFLFTQHAFSQNSFFSAQSEQLKSDPKENQSQYSIINNHYEQTLVTEKVKLTDSGHSENYSLSEHPKTPVLTTKSNLLEVCEGNSTTLTATSDYPIEWYTNYPPEGEPVGRGEVFVTPILNQGYYIYHAVANNNGLRSKSSEMEVVMVYPLPFIQIVESAQNICAGESVTLSAFGTRFYFWNTGETSNEIVIQPKQNTSYTVTGMNTAGCKSVQRYTQLVENCSTFDGFMTIEKKTGLSDELKISAEPISSIYPNPNTGEFKVKLNRISESTRIELYNSYGYLVYETKVNDEETSIRLMQNSKGIYTLRILDQDQVLKQEKVLIED